MQSTLGPLQSHARNGAPPSISSLRIRYYHNEQNQWFITQQQQYSILLAADCAALKHMWHSIAASLQTSTYQLPLSIFKLPEVLRFCWQVLHIWCHGMQTKMFFAVNVWQQREQSPEWNMNNAHYSGSFQLGERKPCCTAIFFCERSLATCDWQILAQAVFSLESTYQACTVGNVSNATLT